MENSVFRGRIRPVRARDLKTVVTLVAGLAAQRDEVATVTPRDLARDVLGADPWVRLLLAEEEGAVIGYAALCPLMQLQFGTRGMDLHQLFVVREARGRGVARALIRASKAVAQGKGCGYLVVEPHPADQAAPHIGAAMGFERLGPPGPRFFMALEPVWE